MSDAELDQPGVITPEIVETTAVAEGKTKTKITNTEKWQIADVYRKTGDLTQAARSVGCDPRTVRRLRQEDASFNTLMNESLEQISDRAEGAIVKRLDAGHPAFPIFWLKTRRRAIYGDNVTVQHNVQLQAKIAEASQGYEGQP